jgi:glycolate oxidase FAD binding subunit
MIKPSPAPDDRDDSARIIDALRQARAQRQPVYIVAGGSKRHLLGRDCTATTLDVSGHRGILDYQPGELVLTARAGTPLVDIIDALAEHRQVLAFEPPLFAGSATLGGTLASNLNGPARPWAGSIRDAVLGVGLINGRCERLKFGGKVMKNVAGFDVSRLQAGALGTLGVLCDVSLKVLPRPQLTLTLRYALPADVAMFEMNRRAGEAKPLSGAMWVDGQLYLRLSGASRAVEGAAAQWGGEVLPAEGAAIWQGLRDMTLPFFAGSAPLCRLSMQSTAPVNEQLGATLIDWGGAQRWVRGQHAIEALQPFATGGHATIFGGGERSGEVRAPLSAAQRNLHLRLKQSFDPDRILNPGRMYSWL